MDHYSPFRCLFAFIFVLQILLCFGFESYAQANILGTVTDVKGKGIAHANVLLLRPKDSSLIKGAIGDAAGKYAFQHVPAGDYMVAASFAGFLSAYTAPFHVAGREDKKLNGIELIALSAQLKTVTVQAKKPPFEQKIDRMVINVQSSITSAGSSALDILEKSPGIIVDRQNTAIIMAGKEGVAIMINGKVNRMPASAIVQMLSGMSADNIEKIELITTPPSTFDAEGNAGFINIVLKTNPDFGTNGSYALTVGYSKRETAAASINLNHRKGKINLYGDYSFSRTHFIQLLKLNREIGYQNRLTENSVNMYRDAIQQNHNIRAGLDYQPSKKTTLGAIVSSYNNHWSMDGSTYSSYIVNKVLDTTSNTSIDEKNHWQHYMANFYVQHSISAKERLSFDVDYLYYKNNNPIDYLNSFYDGAGNFVYDQKMKSGKLTPIRVYVGKLDYFRQLGKRIDFEAGLKLTLSRFNNNVSVLRSEQTEWIVDDAFSAEYLLKENIGAAYSLLYIKATENTNVNLGLRYEHTTSNLGTQKELNIVDRNYGRLFPSVFISRKLNDARSIHFSYSRRITRPAFNELAPWVIFFDPNTFMSGNAALQPSVANSVKWDYLFGKSVFSLAYTHEDDVIVRFLPKVDAATNKQRITSENIDSRKTFTTTIALPLYLAKCWSRNSAWQEPGSVKMLFMLVSQLS